MTGGGHRYNPPEPGPEFPRKKSSALFNGVWAGIINACKAVSRIYLRDWGQAIHYLNIAQGRMGEAIGVIRSEKTILDHLDQVRGNTPEPAEVEPDLLGMFSDFLERWTDEERKGIEELKAEMSRKVK